ncbi:hypothetical protein L873DRAFT_1843230 [Choiromyces venosus 120613-1]|uniref:Uncharacterized protein n=1 Tax=Choiromyces venosus 120613-1 TaxID=1336337 RepID=A0A3N4JT66_9PEZI|nr:hypothetical protein L873DRAFT_1843230 [Choiromyces venosus 120613-1]
MQNEQSPKKPIEQPLARTHSNCHYQWLLEEKFNMMRLGFITKKQNQHLVFWVGKVSEAIKNGPIPRNELDICLRPVGSPLPSLAIVSGWTEAYEKMLSDTRLWMRSGHGGIRKVFLLKWSKTPLHEIGCDLEVYEWDKYTKAARLSQHEVVLPENEDLDELQVVKVLFSEIFGKKFPDTDPNSSYLFSLGRLRSIARKAIEEDGYGLRTVESDRKAQAAELARPNISIVRELNQLQVQLSPATVGTGAFGQEILSPEQAPNTLPANSGPNVLLLNGKHPDASQPPTSPNNTPAGIPPEGCEKPNDVNLLPDPSATPHNATGPTPDGTNKPTDTKSPGSSSPFFAPPLELLPQPIRDAPNPPGLEPLGSEGGQTSPPGVLSPPRDDQELPPSSLANTELPILLEDCEENLPDPRDPMLLHQVNTSGDIPGNTIGDKISERVSSKGTPSEFLEDVPNPSETHVPDYTDKYPDIKPESSPSTGGDNVLIAEPNPTDAEDVEKFDREASSLGDPDSSTLAPQMENSEDTNNSSSPTGKHADTEPPATDASAHSPNEPNAEIISENTPQKLDTMNDIPIERESENYADPLEKAELSPHDSESISIGPIDSSGLQNEGNEEGTYSEPLRLANASPPPIEDSNLARSSENACATGEGDFVQNFEATPGSPEKWSSPLNSSQDSDVSDISYTSDISDASDASKLNKDTGTSEETDPVINPSLDTESPEEASPPLDNDILEALKDNDAVGEIDATNNPESSSEPIDRNIGSFESLTNPSQDLEPSEATTGIESEKENDQNNNLEANSESLQDERPHSIQPTDLDTLEAADGAGNIGELNSINDPNTGSISPEEVKQAQARSADVGNPEAHGGAQDTVEVSDPKADFKPSEEASSVPNSPQQPEVSRMAQPDTEGPDEKVNEKDKVSNIIDTIDSIEVIVDIISSPQDPITPVIENIVQDETSVAVDGTTDGTITGGESLPENMTSPKLALSFATQNTPEDAALEGGSAPKDVGKYEVADSEDRFVDTEEEFSALKPQIREEIKNSEPENLPAPELQTGVLFDPLGPTTSDDPSTSSSCDSAGITITTKGLESIASPPSAGSITDNIGRGDVSEETVGATSSDRAHISRGSGGPVEPEADMASVRDSPDDSTPKINEEASPAPEPLHEGLVATPPENAVVESEAIQMPDESSATTTKPISDRQSGQSEFDVLSRDTSNAISTDVDGMEQCDPNSQKEILRSETSKGDIEIGDGVISKTEITSEDKNAPTKDLVEGVNLNSDINLDANKTIEIVEQNITRMNSDFKSPGTSAAEQMALSLPSSDPADDKRGIEDEASIPFILEKTNSSPSTGELRQASTISETTDDYFTDNVRLPGNALGIQFFGSQAFQSDSTPGNQVENVGPEFDSDDTASPQSNSSEIFSPVVRDIEHPTTCALSSPEVSKVSLPQFSMPNISSRVASLFSPTNRIGYFAANIRPLPRSYDENSDITVDAGSDMSPRKGDSGDFFDTYSDVSGNSPDLTEITGVLGTEGSITLSQSLDTPHSHQVNLLQNPQIITTRQSASAKIGEKSDFSGVVCRKEESVFFQSHEVAVESNVGSRKATQEVDEIAPNKADIGSAGFDAVPDSSPAPRDDQNVPECSKCRQAAALGGSGQKISEYAPARNSKYLEEEGNLQSKVDIQSDRRLSVSSVYTYVSSLLGKPALPNSPTTQSKSSHIEVYNFVDIGDILQEVAPAIKTPGTRRPRDRHERKISWGDIVNGTNKETPEGPGSLEESSPDQILPPPPPPPSASAEGNSASDKGPYAGDPLSLGVRFGDNVCSLTSTNFHSSESSTSDGRVTKAESNPLTRTSPASEHYEETPFTHIKEEVVQIAAASHCRRKSDETEDKESLVASPPPKTRTVNQATALSPITSPVLTNLFQSWLDSQGIPSFASNSTQKEAPTPAIGPLGECSNTRSPMVGRTPRVGAESPRLGGWGRASSFHASNSTRSLSPTTTVTQSPDTNSFGSARYMHSGNDARRIYPVGGRVAPLPPLSGPSVRGMQDGRYQSVIQEEREEFAQTFMSESNLISPDRFSRLEVVIKKFAIEHFSQLPKSLRVYESSASLDKAPFPPEFLCTSSLGKRLRIAAVQNIICRYLVNNIFTAVVPSFCFNMQAIAAELMKVDPLKQALWQVLTVEALEALPQHETASAKIRQKTVNEILVSIGAISASSAAALTESLQDLIKTAQEAWEPTFKSKAQTIPEVDVENGSANFKMDPEDSLVRQQSGFQAGCVARPVLCLFPAIYQMVDGRDVLVAPGRALFSDFYYSTEMELQAKLKTWTSDQRYARRASFTRPPSVPHHNHHRSPHPPASPEFQGGGDGRWSSRRMSTHEHFGHNQWCSHPNDIEDETIDFWDVSSRLMECDQKVLTHERRRSTGSQPFSERRSSYVSRSQSFSSSGRRESAWHAGGSSCSRRGSVYEGRVSMGGRRVSFYDGRRESFGGNRDYCGR